VSVSEYLQRLWMGSVTARENIRWFIPIWLWMGLVVCVELAKLPFEVLFYTFFFVFFASMIPFFCRRVGLFRWWVFGCVLPVSAAAAVTQCLRLLFHIS
jgi:hypothetical protein